MIKIFHTSENSSNLSLFHTWPEFAAKKKPRTAKFTQKGPAKILVFECFCFCFQQIFYNLRNFYVLVYFHNLLKYVEQATTEIVEKRPLKYIDS